MLTVGTSSIDTRRCMVQQQAASAGAGVEHGAFSARHPPRPVLDNTAGATFLIVTSLSPWCNGEL